MCNSDCSMLTSTEDYKKAYYDESKISSANTHLTKTIPLTKETASFKKYFSLALQKLDMGYQIKLTAFS